MHTCVIPSLLIVNLGTAFCVQVEPVSLGNQHRLNFGELGSLEAGAVAARVSDPAAVWYNPARLTSTGSPSISGNASIYESATTRFRTSDGSYDQSTINTIPGYVGATGMVGDAPLVWGFGVFMPLYWDSSLENRNTITVTYGPPNPGSYALDTIGRVSVTSNLLVPAFAVAYRGGDGWGCGASLLLPYYRHRLERNTSEISVTRGAYRSYWEIQEQAVAAMRLGLGAFRTVGPFELAVSIKSPSLRLMSSSTAEWHAVSASFATGTSTTTDAHIGDGRADFRSPFEATVAAAWRNGWFGTELDLTYLGHVAAYQTVEGDLPITARRFNTSTGFDLTTSSTGTPGTLELKQDLNIAMGCSVDVTPAVSAHAGFSLDKSQVVNSDEFTPLNLATLSIGLLHKTRRSALFAGGYYQWSNTGDVRVFNTATSAYENAQASVSTIGLSLGASYYLE